MKEVILTRGLVAIVDDADFDKVSGFKYRAVGKAKGGPYYAMRNTSRRDKPRRGVHLHQDIVGPVPEGFEIHHKDGDPLNCRRGNLEPTTHQKNMQGTRKRVKHSSRFRGVSYKHRGWEVNIQDPVKRRGIYLGRFQNEEEAARCYDAAARELFKEFADVNLPTPQVA